MPYCSPRLPRNKKIEKADTFPMSTDQPEKQTKCPLCGSAAGRDFVKYDQEFHSCTACGLGFIHPPPPPDEIERIYNKNYYDSWGIDSAENSTERMKQATFHDKLALIERSLPAKGRILDIGCATGFFLDASRQRGWECHGVELSPYSSEIAREKIGRDRIFTGQLAEACFADDFFDAVVMTDVIEHVAAVGPFMAEAARILKPGGIAAITTPDPLSLSCRLLGRHWPHYKREHLLYFTADALSLLMEPLGFRRLSLTPGTKTLTLSYLTLQLQTYPVPLLTPLVKLIAKLLPESVCQLNFRIYSGELFELSRLEDGVRS